MFNWFKNLFSFPSSDSWEKQIAYRTDQSIAVLTSFVRDWSDRKICDVLAFCEDGKMNFGVQCCCLLGVFGSEVIHTRCGMGGLVFLNGHPYPACKGYEIGRAHPCGPSVERAYLMLGGAPDLDESDLDNGQWLRDARMIKILRAELSRREGERELREILGLPEPSKRDVIGV